MTSWYSFTNTSATFQLGKETVSRVCNEKLDEDRLAKIITKNWCTSLSDALQKVDKDIDDALAAVSDDVLQDVIAYLSADDEAEGTSQSFFIQRNDENNGIRTAVVKCGFADADRLIKSVERGMSRKNDGIVTVIVDKVAPIHTVVDQIREEKKEVLLVFQQAELLTSEFIHRLFSVISSQQLDLSVLVCVSTNSTFFASLCSERIINILSPRYFSFCSSGRIWTTVLNVIRNQLEDKIYFSGSLWKYIKDQFDCIEFCHTSVKNTLRLAILQHYRDHPEHVNKNAELEEFEQSVCDWNICMRLLTSTLDGNMDDVYLKFRTDENFWRSLKESGEYQSWRQWLGKASPDELRKLIDEETFQNCSSKLDKSRRQIMLAIDKLEETKEENLEDMPNPEGTHKAIKEKRLTLLELREMNMKAAQKNRNRPDAQARSDIVVAIERMLQQTLTPWEKFPHSKDFLAGSTFNKKSSIEISSSTTIFNHQRGIEDALFADTDSERCPQTIAWKTLMQSFFKGAKLAEWGTNYADQLSHTPRLLDKKNIVPSYFACVGQFEHMGIIKPSSDRSLPSINILYHPTSKLP